MCSSIWGYTLFFIYKWCKTIIERGIALSKRPNLDELDSLFEKGIDFTLTDVEYEAITGASLPKGINYIKKGSALARKAAEKGYVITEVQEKPIVERIVFLEKKEEL